MSLPDGVREAATRLLTAYDNGWATPEWHKAHRDLRAALAANGCSEPTRCKERDKAECEWCMSPVPSDRNLGQSAQNPMNLSHEPVSDEVRGDKVLNPVAFYDLCADEGVRMAYLTLWAEAVRLQTALTHATVPQEVLERLAVSEFNSWCAGIHYDWSNEIDGIGQMDLGEAVPALVSFYRDRYIRGGSND